MDPASEGAFLFASPALSDALASSSLGMIFLSGSWSFVSMKNSNKSSSPSAKSNSERFSGSGSDCTDLCCKRDAFSTPNRLESKKDYGSSAFESDDLAGAFGPPCSCAMARTVCKAKLCWTHSKLLTTQHATFSLLISRRMLRNSNWLKMPVLPMSAPARARSNASSKGNFSGSLKHGSGHLGKSTGARRKEFMGSRMAKNCRFGRNVPGTGLAEVD